MTTQRKTKTKTGAGHTDEPREVVREVLNFAPKRLGRTAFKKVAADMHHTTTSDRARERDRERERERERRERERERNKKKRERSEI